MYEVIQNPTTEEFRKAWQQAGRHIQNMGSKGIYWLRANLMPPMAEHLSFRLGNQLIFIFVETPILSFDDSYNKIFLEVAQEATAIPCLMPMRKNGDRYEAVLPAWGLRHAITKEAVNPSDLVSDKLIEMSNWELHDFAIQNVRDYLEKERKKVVSFQPSPHIDPTMWFEDENGKHWVVVRADRYPVKEAKRPNSFEDVKIFCSKMSQSGYFASVCVASANDKFDSKAVTPLYRGHAMYVNFSGLEAV